MENQETPDIDRSLWREITDADYQKAEMDLLREGLKRSYKERFLMATTLYKVQQSLNRAKIIHKPANS